MNIPLIRPFRLLTRIIALLGRIVAVINIFAPDWRHQYNAAMEKGVSLFDMQGAYTVSHAPYMEHHMIYAWRYWALVNRPIHRFALYLITLSQYSFFVTSSQAQVGDIPEGRNAKWTTSLQDIFSCCSTGARIIKENISIE